MLLAKQHPALPSAHLFNIVMTISVNHINDLKLIDRISFHHILQSRISFWGNSYGARTRAHNLV